MQTANQLYQRKVKDVIVIIISERALITLKTHGKELNQ